MHSSPTEEKYPLLLLYVDENGKRSEFPRKVVFADKGRGKILTKGTINIMSQWPAQVTSCWLTALTFALSFILLLMLMLITSIKFADKQTHLRCTRHAKNNPSNQTIHLVKDGNEWEYDQLEIFNFIVNSFPDYNIHCTIVEHSPKHVQDRSKRDSPTENSATTKNATVTRSINTNSTHSDNSLLQRIRDLFLINELSIENESDFIFPDFLLHNTIFNSTAKKRVKRDRHRNRKAKAYAKILKENANIKEKKTTFKSYFSNTALQYFWMDIPHEMLIFAVRAQELWQHGGVSFYLPTVNGTFQYNSSRNKSGALNIDNGFINRLKNLIIATRERYQNLKNDLVSIDGEGLHMATKIPCHSFFGEILMKLQHDVGTTSVPDFIHKLLNVFCESGVVDSDYCNKRN